MKKSAKLEQARENRKATEATLIDAFSAIWEKIEAKEPARRKRAWKKMRYRYPGLVTHAERLCELSDIEAAKTPAEFKDRYWLWYGRKPFLAADGTLKEEVKEIGLSLHEAGGIKAMIAAMQCVPKIDQQQLDMAFFSING